MNLTLRNLSQGELPIYDLGALPCFVIGSDGEALVQVSKPPRLILPIFPVSASDATGKAKISDFAHHIRMATLERSLALNAEASKASTGQPLNVIVVQKNSTIHHLPDGGFVAEVLLGQGSFAMEATLDLTDGFEFPNRNLDDRLVSSMSLEDATDALREAVGF